MPIRHGGGASNRELMNLTRLRYFVAVAETENVVRAARALNVAQPALSRQLRSLEQEVGAPLFERHPKGVRLTPAGAALLSHAREAIRAADAGLVAARKASATTTINVSPPDWPHRTVFVADARERLRATRPDIEVVFNSTPWTTSVTALRAGEVDVGFGIAPIGIPYPDDIGSELLLNEPGTSALIAADHPLARRGTVRLADLRHVPSLIPPREEVGALHDQMLAVIRTGGYEPKVVPAPLHYSAATHMAALGAGWILTVNSVAELLPSGCVALPIEDARLDLGFHVLRRRNDDRPAVAALISTLRDVVHCACPPR